MCSIFRNRKMQTNQKNLRVYSIQMYSVFTSNSDQMSPHVAPAFLALTWQKESGTMRNHLLLPRDHHLDPFGTSWYPIFVKLPSVMNHESCFSCSPQNWEFLHAFTVYKTFWDTNLSKFLGIFFQPTQEQSNHPQFSYWMASLNERLWIESVGPYIVTCLYVYSHTLFGRTSPYVMPRKHAAVVRSVPPHTQHAASAIVASFMRFNKYDWSRHEQQMGTKAALAQQNPTSNIWNHPNAVRKHVTWCAPLKSWKLWLTNITRYR